MTKKSYTVPLTGEVRWADKIGNPNDDDKMPTRFEARFDTFLNGKTDAQILSDASKPALVKI